MTIPPVWVHCIACFSVIQWLPLLYESTVLLVSVLSNDYPSCLCKLYCLFECYPMTTPPVGVHSIVCFSIIQWLPLLYESTVLLVSVLSNDYPSCRSALYCLFECYPMTTPPVWVNCIVCSSVIQWLPLLSECTLLFVSALSNDYPSCLSTSKLYFLLQFYPVTTLPVWVQCIVCFSVVQCLSTLYCLFQCYPMTTPPVWVHCIVCFSVIYDYLSCLSPLYCLFQCYPMSEYPVLLVSVLSNDYPSCLSTLMRYPPVGDIHFFIEKARHLRDPHVSQNKIQDITSI